MSKRPVTSNRKHNTGKPAGKKSSGPKSFKSDGTPKARWSSAERAERGHSPRRGGGRPRSESRGFDGERVSDRSGRNFAKYDPRDDRGGRNFDRDDRGGRNFDRDDRPRRNFDRDDRGGRNFDRDDRPRRNFDRDDRGGRNFDRDDRPRRNFDRDDRGGRNFDRDDRPRRDFDRNDRFERRDRFDRDDRPRHHDRDDRPRRFERDDRPRRHDRFDEGARFEKGGRYDRPERRTTEEFDADTEQDNMSWEQAEDVEVDTATVADDADFAQLGVPKELVAVLQQRGITTPFPIQQATIPDALAGRDVLGRGRTGSGKTLGFGLPLVARLAAQPDTRAGRNPRAVIMVPTRELALQVADVVSPLSQAMGLKVILIAGGMSYGPQLKAFERGVDVVVATPGRLIDLMDQGAADLSDVQVAVLDEADHMADLGFLPDVTRILDSVPGDGQRLLFSATLDRGIDKVVQKYLHDPVTHEVDSAQAEVTTMEHHVFHVQPNEKVQLTALIANRPGRTVIFVRTQRGADRGAEQLREAGTLAGALHGGLTQGARARILAAFKDGSLPVLVATDVAARGIHVDEVSLVLQVDPPMGPKDYLHRAGRTARAGEAGAVVSLVLPHQKREVTRLTKQAGVQVTPLVARLADPQIAEITGGSLPEGEPITEDDYRALIAPKKQERRPRKQYGDRDRRGGNRYGGGGRKPYRGRGGRRD